MNFTKYHDDSKVIVSTDNTERVNLGILFLFIFEAESRPLREERTGTLVNTPKACA